VNAIAPAADQVVHGTAVAIGAAAALIRGPSGSGKSDLALRFLALDMGALARQFGTAAGEPRLVADDQVCLQLDPSAAGLIVRAPGSIRSKLEVRGLGIVDLASADAAWLRLVVDLVAGADVERLPDPAPEVRLLDRDLPLVRLDGREASAPIKLYLALARAAGR
jgi:serine kinase of HPr protein (carbohydrate metabolism regulator)